MRIGSRRVTVRRYLLGLSVLFFFAAGGGAGQEVGDPSDTPATPDSVRIAEADPELEPRLEPEPEPEPEPTGAVVSPAAAVRRGPFFGLWRWWGDARDPGQALLYQRARAIESDSLLYEMQIVERARSDTIDFPFVSPERWRFSPGGNALRTEQGIDLEAGRVFREDVLNGRPIGERATYSSEEFMQLVTASNFRSQWIEAGRLALAHGADRGGSDAFLQINLPPVPGFARSIFGDGQSSLSVSGSERISLSGVSTWRPYQKTAEFGGQSKFPDLDMKQDLFLKLQGTIGDKVHVDIDQNSNAQTSLENRIRIRYDGYEDDVIRRVNLGNTSLSLPGTKYVSYGGRHEGLFGISAEGQLGPVSLTTIASKQESEATTRSVPGRNSESTPIRDIKARDYVRRTFFFLDDPNRVGVNQDGDSVLVPVPLQDTDIRLYRDDYNARNDDMQNAFPVSLTPTGLPPCDCLGADPADCDSVSMVADVMELRPGVDYVIHLDGADDFAFSGTVIELTQPLADEEILAAAYITDLDGDLVASDTVGTWSARSEFLDEDPCRFTFKMIAPPRRKLNPAIAEGVWGGAHNLECRNFYRLGGQNIAEESLELDIVWDAPGTTRPTIYRDVPYIEITGLDIRKEVGTSYEDVPDGNIDRRCLDLGKGILHFPQLRPFAPDYYDITYRREGNWPEFQLVSDPDSAGAGNFWEPDIYDSLATVFRTAGDTHVDRYFMEGRFNTPTSTIELNAFNIIEGSETVTAGTRELVRGRDYDIDYEFGSVTIKETAEVTADEEINVSFAYAPLFGTSSRTLLGISSSVRPEGGNYGFSSTWFFESKGNPDRRVKLGEEPTRTLIGEFAGNYKTESALLTNLVGRLPFYTPATRSQLTMGGAVGLSVPNLNTKGQAYIDDFDGSRDARELSMTQRAWQYPSIPEWLREHTGLTDVEIAKRRGDQIWYTPRRAAVRGDLNPTLSKEEADDGIPVLEFWMEPVDSLVDPKESWFGLTQSISKTGEDLSTAQFLEIWFNDFQDEVIRDTLRTAVGDSIFLYVDIGEVSEDAVWRPAREPVTGFDWGFGVLDTEDADGDGLLDETVDTTEDTGLDGIESGNQDAEGRNDSAFDDWGFGSHEDEEDDPEENRDDRYARVNGMEGNSALDTEDLDGLLRLDTENNYFTYRFELSSTDPEIVVTNVCEDFEEDYEGGCSRNRRWPNGWRRIRFPLGSDYEFRQVGTPDWTRIKHIRLWFTGLAAARPIQIASVQLVGNRWLSGGEEAPIMDDEGKPVSEEDLKSQEKFVVSVVNNKENLDIWERSFELERDRDQHAEELEQYLSLDLYNFPGDPQDTWHSATCYRRFAQDQDYTFYETLEFYTKLGIFDSPDADVKEELDFFIRFGTSDGNTYYEYRKKVVPLPRNEWEHVKLPLSELSNLKQNLAPQAQEVKETKPDGSILTIKGRPSFTRIRRITLGVENTSGGFVNRASVWVNELRLNDVERNTAMASQFQVSAMLSDLGSVSFNWRGHDADFLQVGQTRGRGNTEQSLGYQTTMNIDRFFSRLQMRIPLSYSFSKSTTEPKFRVGDDLIYQGRDRDLNISETMSRGFTASYKRSPSENPLLRYTLDGFSGDYSVSRSTSHRPAQRDTTTNWSARVAYNFTTPRHELVRLPLGMRLDYLPTTFSTSGSVNNQRQVIYQRPSSDLTNPLERLREDNRRTATMGWSTAYRMLDNPNINYNLSSSRDLMTEGARVGGVKLGVETSRSEKLSAGYSFKEIPEDGARFPLGTAVRKVVNGVIVPLRPNLNWSGNFDGRLDMRITEEGGARPRDVNNSATATVGGVVPVTSIYRGLKEQIAGAASPQKEPDQSEREEAREERRRSERNRLPGTRRTGGGPRGGGGAEGEQKKDLSKPKLPFAIGFHVDDLSVQFRSTRTSNHSRLDRMPSILYQLGLSRDVGPDARPRDGTERRFTDSNSINLGSGLQIRKIRVGTWQSGGSLDLTANYSRENSDGSRTSLRKNQLTGNLQWTDVARNPSVSTGWPDIQITASNVEKGIAFLEKRFRSVTLRSRYTRSEDVSGDEENPEETRRISSDWTPFLSIETSLKSGMRLSFRSNRRRSESTYNQTVQSTQINESSDLSFNLQHTMQWKKKIPNPLGRGQKIITTNVDVALGLDISSRRTATVAGIGGGPEREGDNSRQMKVSAEAGYGFTRSIHGTASIHYTENKYNNALQNTSRSLGLTLTATFQF